MISSRLKKLEERQFTDDEILTIVNARRFFYYLTEQAGEIAPLSKDRAVLLTVEEYPGVEASMITRKLTGRLAAAEKKILDNRIPSDMTKAEQFFYQLMTEEDRTVNEAIEEVKNKFPNAMREFADLAKKYFIDESHPVEEALSLMVRGDIMPAEFLPEVRQYIEQ